MNATTQATAATPAARPMVDARTKAPSLAESAAKAKGLKQPVKAAKAAAPAPKAKAAKPAAKAKAPAKAKPAAKAAKPKAPKDPNAVKERLVPADLTKYHIDKAKKTAGGHPSVDSNDTLAQKLRGLSLDAVYKEAARTLKEPEAELRAKYAHLNPGMQRMNLGNRMRAADGKRIAK